MPLGAGRAHVSLGGRIHAVTVFLKRCHFSNRVVRWLSTVRPRWHKHTRAGTHTYTHTWEARGADEDTSAE